jgi:excisionase family DNA binding protein
VRRGRAPSRCAPLWPLTVPARRPAPGAGLPSPGRAGSARIDAWLGAGCQARPGTAPDRLDGAGGVEGGCLRSRAGGQRAPSAGIRAGCHCPRQRRGRARGHRPGPPRARPCRPSPPAGPGRPRAPRPAAQSVRGAFPLLPGPRPGCPGQPPAAPVPAGAGLDAAGEAERPSTRTTDGPPPGTQTAPGRPPATPANEPGTPADPLLTIEEVTAELRVSRAAFYRWRRQGAGPPAVRLPGGGVRVRRSALSAWLRQLELEEEMQDGQEQTADGQLRRQVLGYQEARQRPWGHGSGSGGRSTGASTASRSRPAPSPTGSSTASKTQSATGGPSTRAAACPRRRRPGTSW